MRTNNFVVLIGIKSQELKKGVKTRFESQTANQGFLLNIFMLLKVTFSFSNPLLCTWVHNIDHFFFKISTSVGA